MITTQGNDTMGQLLRKHSKAGHYRPTTEMPYEWHFVGGPIAVRESVLAILTHLCLMEFPPLSIGRLYFEFKGCWVLSNLHFLSNLKSIFCKQLVRDLIRRRVLRSLIWFCSVCRSPIKRTS